MIGDKHKIWINKISKFLLGQGLLQLINLITGFFILRWLSIQDYAQFGTALAFQSSLSMLVDMGFSGSIIAMVGPNIHDKNLVGSYINIAKVFRNKLLIILGIPSAFLFLYLGNNLGWSYLQIGILFCSIISAVFFSRLYLLLFKPIINAERDN